MARSGGTEPQCAPIDPAQLALLVVRNP